MQAHTRAHISHMHVFTYTYDIQVVSEYILLQMYKK